MKLIGIVGVAGAGKDQTAAYMVEGAGFTVAALADRIKQLAHKIFEFDEPTLFGPSALRNAVDPRGADPRYWRAVYYRAGMRSEELAALFAYAPPGALTGSPVAAFRALLDQLADAPEKFSARHALQQMGTEWGRTLWTDVWVVALRTTIRKLNAGYGYSRLLGVQREQGEAPPGVVVTDMRFPNEIAALKSWGGKAYWIDAEGRGVTRVMDHPSEPKRAEFDTLVDGVVDNGGTLAELREAALYLARA